MNRIPRWFSLLQRRTKAYLSRCVAIDSRTLAVFRIFVGILVVGDVLSRSRNFSFYYTDDGVVPQGLAETYTTDGAFSFFFYTSDPTIIGALFLVHALIGIQLILGYKTRVATILTFLFVVSLDHHNPFVTSYADTLFRLLLFWAIFLPLGERWSIDAVHRTREARTRIVSAASALILGQMIYMWVVNGYHKSQNVLWTQGEATPLIFGIDEMTFLLGDFMRANVMAFLELGGFLWYYMLISAWLLFFLQGRLRLLFATLFVGGHLSFALTVRIGAFGYVALTGALLFYQTQFWRDGRRVLEALRIDIDRLYRTLSRTSALASYFPVGQKAGPRQRTLRKTVYTFTIGVVVLSMVLVVVLSGLVMAGTVDEDHDHDRQIEDLAERLSIDQPTWSVFAPNPRTTDRYYVFPAETVDGDKVDVFNERELTYTRPHDELQNQHDVYRERFYMNSIRRGDENSQINQQFVAYLCESWEEEHGTALTNLNMWYVNEDITPETIIDDENRDRSAFRIGQFTCDDSDPALVQRPEL